MKKNSNQQNMSAYADIWRKLYITESERKQNIWLTKPLGMLLIWGKDASKHKPAKHVCIEATKGPVSRTDESP